VRLGLAFGLLGGALLAIGITSLLAVDNLDARARALADKNVAAETLLVDAGERLQGIAHLTVRHLYVYDGDLAQQNAVARRVASLAAGNRRDVAALGRVLDDAASKAAATRFAARSRAYRAAYARALRLSRTETVRKASRDGSRRWYETRVVPSLDRADAALTTLKRAVDARAGREAEHAQATTSSGRRTILVVLAVALAAAAALGVVITRSITRPVAALVTRLRSLNERCLEELGRGLQAMAEGDLTVAAAASTRPVDARSKDELGDLGRTFNSMLGKAEAGIAAY
jgi:methyl-accepting chemotaxis protein